MKHFFTGFGFILAMSFLATNSVAVESTDAQARLAVHLVNYIRADYPGAVSKAGVVASEAEYKEQVEFVDSLQGLVESVPALKADAQIQKWVSSLQKAVKAKAAPDTVEGLCGRLSPEMIRLTHLVVSPARVPDRAHAKFLFQKNCVRCHGINGHGDGPSSGTVDPKPTNFHEAKMDSVPPFHAYNAIRLGVPGTAMASFEDFSDQEAWDLAFYVVSLRHEALAQTTAAQKFQLPTLSLKEIAVLSDDELKAQIPGKAEDKALAVARIRVEGIQEESRSSIPIAREKLDATLLSARTGDWASAKNHAVLAYLEGVEPAEPRLRAKDATFTADLEQKMADVRSAVDRRSGIEEISFVVQEAQAALAKGEAILIRTEVSPWLTFSVAAGIFLREAFEAVLILITLLGVIRSIGSKKAAMYVHGGWILALLVGLLSWFFSGWLVGISGANRELLEGGISLFAVLVLLYFGFWLHQKTEIGRWRAFINEMVRTAVDGKNLIALGGVAFMAVFREAFETVLFLRALSIESGGEQQWALAAGVGCSFILVLGLATLLVKFSTRIPIRQLFAVSSGIMVFLSFILIGKGVHSFQETGLLSVTPLPFRWRMDLIGFYPTYETVVPQLIVVVLSLLLWLYPRRAQKLGEQTAA